MRIFHIATAADWAAAQASGSYTTSTIGRTLAEEGFIHASRVEQWQGVRDRFYAGVTEPLVLLMIDTDRLSSPVVEEPVPDSTETFPHVYGPIEPAAVVRVVPLDGRTVGGESFARLFLGEVAARMGLAMVAMTFAVVGAVLGATYDGRWGPLGGLLVGLALGTLVAALIVHRRRQL